MAKNQKYPHNTHISLPAEPMPARKAGEPVHVGNYVGVALTDTQLGENGYAVPGSRITVWLDGSWDLDVTGALEVGQVVYIDSYHKLTATVGSNTPFGIANESKGSGVGTVEVAPFGKLQPNLPA